MSHTVERLVRLVIDLGWFKLLSRTSRPELTGSGLVRFFLIVVGLGPWGLSIRPFCSGSGKVWVQRKLVIFSGRCRKLEPIDGKIWLQ